jgi:hypothetical protein
MAATPESRSKDALRKVLEAIAATLPKTVHETHPAGLWWWWIQPGYGQANAPDVIGRINGAFFAVEAKADPSEGGRPPRPGQERELEAISQSGPVGNQWVGVVGTYEAFDDWRTWMLSHLVTPARTLSPQLREQVKAIPWRTSAALNRRPAPPVLRIRSKKP